MHTVTCDTFKTHIEGIISMPVYASILTVLIITGIFTVIGWLYGKIKNRNSGEKTR